MTAITTRSSVLAVVPESTEGTPITPTSADQFVAPQDDVDFSPEFEVLENAELKASLGSSKPILGTENPTVSFSHYLRHSGVSGTEPDQKEIYKALFGSTNVISSENATTSGSTVSALELATATGVVRGMPLLVQNSSNAYEIRPVESLASTTVTPGFNFINAADNGVNTGKGIVYTPTDDSSNQTLNLWHYVGNGGAVQMVAGCRPTEMSVDITAGQLINHSFSFEGLEYYMNPVEITSSDIYIDFTDDNGTFAAVITADFYKDPHELAAAITTAMNTIQTAETHACTYSDTTGKFTISTSTSAILSLLWNTGSNAANTVGDAIGFSVAADDTGSTSYAADSAMDWSNPVGSVSYDSSDPLAAKDNQLFIGDQDDATCIEASSVAFTLGEVRRSIEDVCATSGVSGSVYNARSITVTVSALLNKYDVDKFRRYRSNSDTRFCYIAGEKSGGNWVLGKNLCLYLPTATITSFDLVDDDGLASIDIELTAYVDSSGNPEGYLGFV